MWVPGPPVTFTTDDIAQTLLGANPSPGNVAGIRFRQFWGNTHPVYWGDGTLVPGTLPGTSPTGILGYIDGPQNGIANLPEDMSLDDDFITTAIDPTAIKVAGKSSEVLLWSYKPFVAPAFLGTDGKVLLSADVQNLFASLSVNAGAIGGVQNAALYIGKSGARIVPGTVDATAVTPTTTVFETSSIVNSQNNYWNGVMGIFTNGPAAGSRFQVITYTFVGGRGHFVVAQSDGVTALPVAPANGNEFILV